MAIFEEVRLEWGGTPHVIPPDQVMRAIAVVEDVITLAQLSRELASGDHKLGRLAQAYARLLRYAGAKVTDEEVYAGLFPGSGADNVLRAVSALNALMFLMVPPSVLKSLPAKEAAAPPGKTPTAAS